MLLKFKCIICGVESEKDSTQLGREDRSCDGCGSIVRWRSIVYCLSQVLFGRPIVIEDMPSDKTINGVGLSDALLYAKPLEQKLSYKNTYYHLKPFLDITNIPKDSENTLDFLISSDVFEHIKHPVSIAFNNVYRMLKATGFLIVTVPFVVDGVTQEWFPRLNRYTTFDFFGETILINRTVDNEIEVHRNPCFHGGGGDTLEMRLFSLPGLVSELSAAGFRYIYILGEDVPDWGILFDRGRMGAPLVASKVPLSVESLRQLEPSRVPALEAGPS